MTGNKPQQSESFPYGCSPHSSYLHKWAGHQGRCSISISRKRSCNKGTKLDVHRCITSGHSTCAVLSKIYNNLNTIKLSKQRLQFKRLLDPFTSILHRNWKDLRVKADHCCPKYHKMIRLHSAILNAAKAVLPKIYETDPIR